MNRRQFLTRIALAAPLIVVPSALARTYFLPPRGGWIQTPGKLYLWNHGSTYYFSAPDVEYLKTLKAATMRFQGGEWCITDEPPPFDLNPKAEMRHTYGTYRRDCEMVAVEFDLDGRVLV